MFSIDNSFLLVIDVQGKLAQRVVDKARVFKNIQALIQMANTLGIPVVWTEQAPEKIGKTIPEISNLLSGHEPIKKMSFSCCGEVKFTQALEKLKRKQVIISGIETHVCVFQTTADLLNAAFEVQVVGDAVSSRAIDDKNLALQRIKSRGGVITSTEMIICELLKTANHEKFKDIMRHIK